MTDERELDSDFSPAVSIADAPSNGTAAHVDTPADAPTPEAPTPDAPNTSASSESADAPPPDGPAVDAAAADGPATGDTATDASTGDAPTAAGATTDSSAAEPPDFLTQLAQAMQATAGAERSRVAEEIERRRSAHVAAIHERRDAEVARMRELADEDRRGIDAWAETEHRRIQAERDRKTTELQVDLTKSLEEHRRQVEDKVQTVEFAVTAHRAEVDAFFDALDAETDPVRIAQQAGRRPVFPDLDAVVAASPPASPNPEPAAVGVMDPIARLGLRNAAEALPVTPAKPVTAGPAGAGPAGHAGPASSTDAASGPSVLAPVSSRTSGRPEESAEPAAASHPSNGLNPMGWLRRGNDQGDH
jgi:hypothetical protein